MGDFSRLARVDIGRIYGPVFCIVDALALSPRDDDSDFTLNNGPGGMRGQVENRNVLCRREDHFFPVARIAILVEVQARGTGLLSQPDDTVTGIGIDPALGGIVGIGLIGSLRANQRREHQGSAAARRDGNRLRPQLTFWLSSKIKKQGGSPAGPRTQKRDSKAGLKSGALG